MITLFMELLNLFASGSLIVPLPGTPIDLFPFGDDLFVLCSDPPSLYTWSEDAPGIQHVPGMDLRAPADLCIWNGEPAVSDPGAGRIVLMDHWFEIAGEPAGICQVDWVPDRESVLAVCLHQTGSVVLVDSLGAVTSLGDFPGARGIAACDLDQDGDHDLCVSCCGSGVFLVENRDGAPVIRAIGNIDQGVKRVSISDLDSDGFPDVAGIACASGGAGWWRNPGNLQMEWCYSIIDPFLQGPKNLWCREDSVIISSLYSPVFFSFPTELELPRGFISVCIYRERMLVAGHSIGFLTVSELDQY